MRRVFELPNNDDLSKEQEKVLRLPLNGVYLITGAPGTGKSVVGLLRTKSDEKYIFLAYNKVLLKSCKDQSELKDRVFTLDFFLRKLYKDNFKEDGFESAFDEWKPNLDYIIQKASAAKIKENNLALVIDEAQDKPVKFYEALYCFGYRNFCFLADQNQQITEECSTYSDIIDMFDIDKQNIFELKENYRNSKVIAKFCSYFHTDSFTQKPELPKETGFNPNPQIITDPNELISHIKNELENYPKHLIGIFVNSNRVREHICNRLAQSNIKASSYQTSDKEVKINFKKGGVVVLNDRSAKGLEFDVVYIVPFGFKIFDENSIKRRFYVMASRARKKLFIALSGKDAQKIKDMIAEALA